MKVDFIRGTDCKKKRMPYNPGMDISGEIWIDGFNLFHAWERTSVMFRGRTDIVAAQDQAIKLLAHGLGKHRKRTLLFMDGGVSRQAATRHGLRLRWCGPGLKADDLMAETMQGKQGKKRIVAISNDRTLAATMRALGAGVMSAGEFVSRFLTPKKGISDARRHELAVKNSDLSSHEVDQWMEVFDAH